MFCYAFIQSDPAWEVCPHTQKSRSLPAFLMLPRHQQKILSEVLFFVFFLCFGGRQGGSWLFLYFASPTEKKQHMIAALLLLTVYEGLFQSHQHRHLCCHVSLSGASMATLSTLHQQLLPPPTTTLAARGNSCIREEPKQQFSSVLSKQLNHTPITHIPPILCQQEKRKAREKHIAQHHT